MKGGDNMDWAYDTLDKLVENGEMTEEEAREEYREYQAQQKMNEMYDMNGDPYNDFNGNPW